MDKPQSIVENETYRIHWDFEIRKDHLIPARRLVMIDKKKENLPSCGFYHPNGP